VTGQEWIAEFAKKLGVQPPDQSTFDRLLDLAGVAAHSSERIAAPIACYLVGLADRATEETVEIARQVAPGS
jgi:hypothetical protein